MKLPLHISLDEKRNRKLKAALQSSYLKCCFLFSAFLLLSTHSLLAQQHPDLPNPTGNIQTATIGSLVIPMDNANQNIGSPFNLKAYGLIHALLSNDIPVKWVIRSDKGKDSVDFSATAERLYPTYVSSAMINFIASAFIIDSVWVNNPSSTSSQTATQIITSYGNNVAVLRLTQNVSVDVRYTLNFRPKIAVFNNGGNQAIHIGILNAGGVTNYITTGAGVFPGIFQCFTFASEPHWAGTYPTDTPITNNIRNFVQAGGNFLVQCRGILTYENLSGFQSNNGIDIKNATVTNNYYNNNMAYMQFHGAMKANQGGSERNWTPSSGSTWVSGFYHGVSHNHLDTIVASGAHLIHPDSMGGNVYYLGGHDYSPFNTLQQINAARLYLNATLVPSGRPSPFTINVGSDASICPGNSVTLGGSPTGPAGAMYTWSPAASMNDSTLSNPTVTPASTSTFYVDVSNGGCYAQGSVTITVASPLASIMSFTNVSCFGGNDGSASAVVSGGIAPYTYLWSNGQTDSVATGLSTGTYSVLVNSAAGCPTNFSVSVAEPISALVSPISATNVSCFGGSNGSAASTASGGTAGYTFLWSSGQTTSSISGLVAGNYSVTTIDSNGCETVSAVSIAEPNQLSCFITPTHVACFGGSNGSASAAVAGGTEGYSYLWSNGQTTSFINGLPAGNYSIAVADTNGCVDTSSVVITEPSTLLSASANQTNVLCNGGSNGSADVLVSGGVPSYSYLWNSGQTSTSVSGLVAGNYSVEITDSNGCTSVIPFFITQPSVITAIISSTPATNCNNNGTANAAVSGGTSPFNYSWSNGQSTGTITGLFPGIYAVTITDSNSCIYNGVSAVLVTGPGAVPANAGQDADYCLGDSTQLNASGGSIYSWFPFAGLSDPNISNPVASPQVTTTYIIYVTDSIGCIGADSMTVIVHPLPSADAGANLSICLYSSDTLRASGGVSYVWSPQTGLNNPNIANPIASTFSTTTYTVTITDANGCLASDTATVMVRSLPVAAAGNDVDVCFNDSSLLNASGGIYYSWSPVVGLSNPAVSSPQASPPSSTTYVVVVSDSSGCSATDALTVTVKPLPLANAGANQSVCLNNSCTLYASGGISCSWSPSTGLNDTTSWNPSASPDSTIIYTVTVSDASGCTNSASTSVTINPVPLITINSTTICIGGNTTLIATGGIQYVWSHGQSTSAILVNPIATTNYDVVVTDANGCSDTGRTSVTVNPIPGVYAGEDTTIMAGSEIQLHGSGGGTNYLWSSETELDCATCLNPFTRPLQTQNYILYTTDTNGCRNSDMVTVFVEDCLVLYVPNAFTPANHDEHNDVFHVSGTCVQDFEFYIYNRWGMQLFESKDLNKGWDGTYLGQSVQQDVYVWIAKARSIGGLSIYKTGKVTVMQ